jgi:hypothetical protein
MFHPFTSEVVAHRITGYVPGQAAHHSGSGVTAGMSTQLRKPSPRGRWQRPHGSPVAHPGIPCYDQRATVRCGLVRERRMAAMSRPTRLPLVPDCQALTGRVFRWGSHPGRTA